jgi:hypothetical protein
LPFSPVELDDRERCSALELSSGVLLSEPCDSGVYSEWPETVPPFFHSALRGMAAPNSPTLFATPEGELLIRRAPTRASPESRYDLVNRHGELLGVLSVPSNEAIIGFGDESVYVVETDALGLQTLRRHPWSESW